MKGVLISVVIPAYNRGEYLNKTLQSVIVQTYRNLEIIVVDDGSEEDINSIISNLKDERIVYYKLPHKNANIARNFGIMKSKGKYIAMLDSDDLWEINHIQDCLNTIEKKNVAGIYGSLKILNPITNAVKPFRVRLPFKNETMVDYLLKMGFGAQTSTLFMTAATAKKVQWDEELFRHQDYDFVIRFYNKYSMEIKENPTVIYRISSGRKKTDFDSCIRFLEKYKSKINPSIYTQYCKNMYNLTCYQNASPIYTRYYKKECIKYKEYITYHDYVSIVAPNTFFYKIKTKIEFIWSILCTNE